MNTRTDYIADSLERSDQRWSAITHGIGFGALLIIFLPYLYYCSYYTDWVGLAGVSLFLFSLILTYGSSALYHYRYFTPHRTYFQRYDHISIFVMIAGSNTPYILILMEGTEQIAFMALFWGLVGVGALYKMLFLNKYPWFSLCFYLALGWLGLLTGYFVYHAIPTISLFYIIAGGIAYTVGTYFFNADHVRYNHTIWHLFVMAGTLFHLIALVTIF